MSYPVLEGYRRERSRFAPWCRLRIAGTAADRGRSVLDSALDSRGPVVKWALAWPEVPGNGRDSQCGGDCREARNVGCAGSRLEGHASGNVAGIRWRTMSSLSAAVRAYSPCK